MTNINYSLLNSGPNMKCPLCEKKTTVFFKIKDTPLYKCQNCSCQFIDNKLFDQNLQLYEESFYKEDNTRFNPLIEIIILFVRKLRIKSLLKYKPNPGKVLEVGCGRGEVLKVLKKRGWDVTGVQISKTIADILNQQGIKTLNCPFEATNLKEKEYDAIIMFQVLEHLKDPVEAIEICKDILKNDGILIIEVPNTESWSCHFGKEKWNAYDVPNHITNFSKDRLVKFMIQKGFLPIEVSTWNFELGPIVFLQTFMNKIFPANNFYQIMQTKGILSYLVFFMYLFLTPFFSVIEVLAVLAGKGSVARVTFKKAQLKK